ncbi:MAG: HEPN domain-containing protein [Janthinobacterium lividum]
MLQPFLVYCSLLKKGQYRQLRDLADVHSGAVDLTGIDQAMRDGVEKRLAFAQEFLSFSENLLFSGIGSEIESRNIVSRAYYAVHHAVRALLLFEERGDVDGHRESIEAVCALLKRNSAARSKLGSMEDFRTEFLDLLDRRHLADYYPYGTNSPNEATLDFAQAAQEAVQFAHRVVEKTREYIAMKETRI